MNKDILIEKIEYLSSLPHSSLVEHCIYLENENDNYKAQKYITDFISENGIICEKDKEIERLNNIINELNKQNIELGEELSLTKDKMNKEIYKREYIIDELEKELKECYEEYKDVEHIELRTSALEDLAILNRIKELKEGKE